MATCRLIVNSALRKLGRLGAGREPRVADQTDVLAALQGLYGSWIAAGTFGRLQDIVPTGTNYMASGGERILRESAATLVVTLPEFVADDYAGNDYGHRGGRYYGTIITVATIDDDTIITVEPSQPLGAAQTPRDGAVVVITDREGGNTQAWVYDGHIKRWQSVDSLQLDDEAPRSASDPEGLSAMLAIEVADMFGAEVGPTTQRQGTRYQVALTQRFGMRREPVPGVYF